MIKNYASLSIEKCLYRSTTVQSLHSVLGFVLLTFAVEVLLPLQNLYYLYDKLNVSVYYELMVQASRA